jgi:hypothetical protein
MTELAKEFGDKDPFGKGAIPVMFSDKIKNYLVLDPQKVRPDGEMDFVAFELTTEERRFKDFASFLKNELATTKSLIKDKKEGTADDEDDEDADQE